MLSLSGLLAVAGPALSQDLPLGPRSDFGKVVLAARQAAGKGVTLEQMFGGSFDSEPLHVYSEGSLYRDLGKAVGRLDILTSKGTAFCTAFVISDKYLMTNHHCFNIEGATVQQASFLTGYLEEGIRDGTRRYEVRTTPVEQDAELDYAIVEVLGDPASDWGHLALSAYEFDPERDAGHALFIIGHPQRMAQHISRKECRSAARKPVTENRLRHTCDTLVGNSGSPIFDDETRKVVALHHAGSSKDGVNFGIPISMIAAQSPLVASLSTTAKTDPALVALQACNAALAKAQKSEDCSDFDAFIAECGDHPMIAFVQPYAENLCLSLQERMAADANVQRCDELAGHPWHPDRASGLMLAEGSDFDAIIPGPAIAACQFALTTFPEHERLLVNLGRALDKDERHEEAVVAYRKAADQGDAVGQNALGFLYRNGLGVEKSHVEAVKWYQRAAHQGYAPAQFNLGLSYTKGDGVPKSPAKAVSWYTKAAEHGYARAQRVLGQSYHLGTGVPKSPTKAIAWYTKAAEQGDADAQIYLGRIYANGEMVPKSTELAIRWFKKAADQGYVIAEYSLGWVYDTSEPRSATQAIRWYTKAAERGYRDAQYNLGRIYEHGLGVQKSNEQALTWYRKAAAQGDEGAKKRIEKLSD